MNNTTVAANILWIVRLLRTEGGDLTPQAVYERQQAILSYSFERVAQALRDISERGYHWSQRYPGVSDACILVGDQRAWEAQ